MVFYHNWKVASTMSEHLLCATYKEMYTPCATETYDWNKYPRERGREGRERERRDLWIRKDGGANQDFWGFHGDLDTLLLDLWAMQDHHCRREWWQHALHFMDPREHGKSKKWLWTRKSPYVAMDNFNSWSFCIYHLSARIESQVCTVMIWWFAARNGTQGFARDRLYLLRCVPSLCLFFL